MPVLLTLERDSNTSLLSEQRRLGPAMHDFAESYSAAAIDARYTPMKTTGAFTVDGNPLFFLTPERDAVVVDQRVFSDLRCVEPMRLKAKETASIGTVRQPMPPRDLARLLITADVVRTYIHIGSQLALVEESTDETGWTGAFEGTHTYFTNEENVDRVAFSLRVGADGLLSVVGR